jgi:hypothetical protein
MEIALDMAMLLFILGAIPDWSSSTQNEEKKIIVM